MCGLCSWSDCLKLRFSGGLLKYINNTWGFVSVGKSLDDFIGYQFLKWHKMTWVHFRFLIRLTTGAEKAVPSGFPVPLRNIPSKWFKCLFLSLFHASVILLLTFIILCLFARFSVYEILSPYVCFSSFIAVLCLARMPPTLDPRISSGQVGRSLDWSSVERGNFSPGKTATVLQRSSVQTAKPNLTQTAGCVWPT
jgi:hypothetical protein